ncbi:GL17378 [Drosophila persimilis]|nr:GL17378 [Drosophila persimilis]
MTYIVDQLFPPVKLDEAATEFSNFNYWRDPIPDLVIPELETALVPPSPNVDKATLRPIPEK